MAADWEPGGICSDASEAPTSPRSPNFAGESLIAAPLPQTKDSGTDSRLYRLHLRISHPAPRPLSTSLNKGEGGCVMLLASGWPLAASVE
ncbi:hypothetical protein [Extibacter muris]|uniref:hypothetical protein n=1 Tax=Extibacter muris TaxID=1796622 RepID=UPI0011AE92AF|nr:hypothetical protein [Extibacter muris]